MKTKFLIGAPVTYAPPHPDAGKPLVVLRNIVDGVSVECVRPDNTTVQVNVSQLERRHIPIDMRKAVRAAAARGEVGLAGPLVPQPDGTLATTLRDDEDERRRRDEVSYAPIVDLVSSVVESIADSFSSSSSDSGGGGDSFDGGGGDFGGGGASGEW